MAKSSFERAARKLISEAGVEINGPNPWDIQVHNPKLYQRVMAGGSLALGESYMDGWWDAEALDQFSYKVMSARLDLKIRKNPKLILLALLSRLGNRQSQNRAVEVADKHYNLSNDLFRAMLDKRLVYTCAYWKNADNLDQAQENKLDLVCRKIGLKPGDKVLDIGCGWGSFAKFAAEKYGAKVVGVTVSKEQAELARELCRGLDVEIRLTDYREINEKFDHIVSLGMFEHVGFKNYRTYMEVACRCLKDDGLFLLHTIGGNRSVVCGDPWMDKYIFPNGMLPSIKQIGQAIEDLFVMEDWHNFGPYYDLTVMAWYHNFKNHWPELSKHYDQRFYRMWSYYLLMNAGVLRARETQLWQIVLSKNGVRGSYESVR